jgi:diguanylate cyclase (GGDEF)-like protein/PAS domain S-box-containing protein
MPGHAHARAGAAGTGSDATATGVDGLGLLAAIALAANEHSDPLRALQHTLSQVGSCTGWQLGHAYLVDPVGALCPTGLWWQADGVALRGFDLASAATPLRHGAGLPGRVLAARAPAWISDLAADADFPRRTAASAAGLRSAFAFPVLAGAKVAAVLEFFAATPREPDPALLGVLAAVGATVGRVFDRAQLRDGQLHAQEILDGAGDAYVAMDAAGLVTGWNRAAEAMFGWSRQQALGQPVSQLIIPTDYRADHDAGMQRFLRTGQPQVMGQPLELEALRRSGEVFPIEMSFWAQRRGDHWHFYSFGRDITARKAREADLAHRALHDDLTGLANRALIEDLITQALARRTRSGTDLAVLFCDLDRFKTVNDSLGHAAGDRLLQAVAARLTGAVRPADTVGRLAGDEFVIVCDDLAGPDEATSIATRILAAMQAPIELADDRYRVSVSIGIAVAGPATGTAEDLLRDADTAMYQAKEDGGARIGRFDDATAQRASNRLRTELDLATCLEGDQLRLHYQPIVSLTDGRIVGVEALLRWQHPTRGLLGPGHFIPVAEDTGMIVPIGAWVLRHACQQAVTWARHGIQGLSIAVNLSVRQLSQAGFLHEAATIIRDTGLDPARIGLDLEVTESLLMHDPHASARILTDLHELGVRLSIDDFGTGYSSLAYLKHFPVDTIKIDRSFITNITTDSRDLSLVAAITSLGHALELTVLAEGVETEAQRARLTTLGADLAQGFLFARPIPAEHLTGELTRQSTMPPSQPTARRARHHHPRRALQAHHPTPARPA